MLYIHQLNHLSQKMADLESVYLVRELKEKTPYPLRDEKLAELFSPFFVSATELQAMDQSLNLIEPTVELVKVLLDKQLPLYESINLQRTMQMLTSLPVHLQNNLTFLQEFQIWQSSSHQDVASLLNRIPQLKAMEEKIKTNEQIKGMFMFLLRNKDFFFNYHDVINEGQVATGDSLREGMEKGYFFHFTLEEETKKSGYNEIKFRIPPEELAEVAVIEDNIKKIKMGIDTAYKANMRVVNLSVILYSYVKWLTGK